MFRTRDYLLEGQKAAVFQVLSNLEKFGELHPLIQKVERVDSDSVEPIFQVFEQPFSWVPITIKYRANVTTTSDDSIQYAITTLPLTSVFLEYKLSQLSASSIQVKVSIEIQSKLIGKGILMYKMLDAQDNTMSSLQNLLSHQN